MADNKKKKKSSFAESVMNGTYESKVLSPNEVPKIQTKSPKKEEKRTWFDTGAFDDGYQFGDLFKTGLATVEDVSSNISAGILGIGEKAVDAGAFAIGKVGSLFGNDKFEDKMGAFIQKDLIDEEALGKKFNINSFTFTGGLNKLLNGNSEKNSVLGEKSDALVQSGGQLLGTAALQMVGIPWYVTTGATSFGGETENALKSGATYNEAGFSGLVSAGAEILTEKLSGGISFGGKTLDAGIKSKISKAITNKTLSNLTKFGIDVVGEGGEEVLSEVLSNVGKKLSYEDEKTWGDILASEEALDSYLESFIGGMVLSGGANVGKVTTSIKQGRDYDTGLTPQEELIVGVETNNRIESVEAEGNKLTAKQKEQIREQVTTEVLNKQKQQTITDDIAPVQEQPTNTIQSVEDIDNQIATLEEQLMATENEAEYQRLSEQIKALEEQANQLEQQDIAPVQTQVNEQVQNEDIVPYQVANVEETQQPTTQEVNSNLPVEVESNTQNIETNNSSIVETGNSVYNKSNKEVVLDERGIDGVGTRNVVEGSNVQEVNEIVPEREYTTREWAEFENRATTRRKTNLSEYERKLSTDIKNNFNKEVVFFDDKNSKYLGGASVKQKGTIYVLGSENVTERTENFVAYHEVLESEILHNKNLKSKYIDVAIEEVINDEGFQKTKESFIDGQENLKNASDRLIAKDIIVDIFAEQQTGINKGYDLNLSDTTLEVIDYNLQTFNNEVKNKAETKQNVEKPTPTQEEIAPVKQELEDLTSDLKETIKDTKKEIKTLKKELNEAKSTISELVEESKGLTEVDLTYFENLSKEAVEQDIAPTRNNLTMEESQELDALEDSPFGLTLEEEARLKELSDTENNSFNMQDTISMDRKSLKALSKNIKTILGLNKAQTTELENAIQEYMTQETATKEDLHRIIDSKFGKQSVETKLDEVVDIQRVIRQTKIKPTDDLRQMTDYFQMKQKNFGKVSMSNSGMSVDKAYQELSGMYPEFFPDNITNSADQFERIIQVANMDKVISENIILPEEKIQDVTDFVYESVQDYKYSEYVKMAEQEYQQGLNLDIAPYEPTIEEIPEIAPTLKVSPEMEQKTLNKNIEKKDVNWEALEDTSTGEQQALIKKKLGDTLTNTNINLDNVEDTSKSVQKQYNPETGQIEDSIEKKTKKQIKQELLKKTGIMNVSLDEANKLPKILMENTDPIRLQEMIFGRGLGTDINNMFFQKVKDNTSEKIRFQNKERAEIKDLGIKARSKESAAVQKYGEKQWVNETTGEVMSYGDRELASEFPNLETQQKIKNASRVIRQKYDSYLDKTNKVLTKLGYDPIPKRKDYMRHFQELNDIFSRVGIPYNYNEMTANDLPTDINGLTADFSPSKNFFASALQRKGVKTTYDAITGIDGYLEGIGNLIYHTEDIQRLRAYEEYIRDTYGENHGFDNLEKLTDEEKAERIEKIQDNHLSNYASWLHEYTNTLAGKKALIDRSIEGLTGRKIYSFLNTTKTQVGRNMIGFNLSSAMTNVVAEVQALAKTNKLATIKGLADTVKNIFVKDGFVEKSNFLTSRFGSDMLSKNLWQKAGDAGFIFMQGTDNFISQLVVRSKYNEFKSKGLTDEQAHIEAGKFASRIMGDRSQGATANIYNSQMLGLVTQFQLEVNNQLYSMFYDTYHESKEVAKGNAAKTAVGMTYTLGQLAVLTHLFGAGFEAMAGYNPTFDILGMLMKAFGLDDEDEEETTGENISQAFKQLVDALPYVNILTGGGRIPVSEAFTGVTDTFKALTGGKDEYGQDVEWADAWKSIKESAPYFLLPSGYSQIKKTSKGLGMYDEDLPIAGSYTDSGNLRFMADDSNWGKIQAGLFGQWATDEAQEYIDSDFKSIRSTDIDEMLELGMISSEYRDYKTGLSKNKKNEDKLDYISGLDVTDEQKTIMANNVLDRDYDVDMSIYDDFGSYEEFDYYYKYPEKYALGSAITDFKDYLDIEDHIWDLKADKDEEGKSITGTRKAKVIEYVNSLDLDIPQKAMLIREEYSSFNDYNYEIVEYVDGLDRDYEEKMKILEALNMKVEEDGTVSWE